MTPPAPPVLDRNVLAGSSAWGGIHADYLAARQKEVDASLERARRTELDRHSEMIEAAIARARRPWALGAMYGAGGIVVAAGVGWVVAAWLILQWVSDLPTHLSNDVIDIAMPLCHGAACTLSLLLAVFAVARNTGPIESKTFEGHLFMGLLLAVLLAGGSWALGVLCISVGWNPIVTIGTADSVFVGVSGGLLLWGELSEPFLQRASRAEYSEKKRQEARILRDLELRARRVPNAPARIDEYAVIEDFLRSGLGKSMAGYIDRWAAEAHDTRRDLKEIDARIADAVRLSSTPTATKDALDRHAVERRSALAAQLAAADEYRREARLIEEGLRARLASINALKLAHLRNTEAKAAERRAFELIGSDGDRVGTAGQSGPPPEQPSELRDEQLALVELFRSRPDVPTTDPEVG